MFADLDNAISRDSMQRLRSSPQGSVLGALNALFSPHPVTGAPSPQQSASGGLLGKMISSQGGGAPSPAGASGGQTAAGGRTTTTNDIRNVLTGQQPANTSTTNTIKDVTEGQQPGNITTTDTIKRDVVGTAPGNISTTDTIKEQTDPASRQQVISDSADTGDKAGQAFSDEFGKHGPEIADDAKAKLESDSAAEGDKAGASFATTFTRKLSDMFASLGKSGGSGSGGAGIGNVATGILGGIGPGILGLSGKITGIVGAVGSALATLPALAGVAGLGVGTALIAGAVGGVIASSPKLKAQFKSIGADAQSMFADAAKPLIPALSAAFAQIPALLKSIEPQLAGIFKTIAPQIGGIVAGLGPVIKGLLGIMQAAAPVFGPVIEGLEKLVSNILPGIETVIKATVPFVSQFAGILAQLGTHIGQFFSAAAPAIGASMKILGDLLNLVGALLPVIVKLGGVFATALVPVFNQFGAAIQALSPFLVTIGGILADLAQAVLGDLGSAFTALAQLLVNIAPALNTLAKSLGAVFTQLENTGVFAEIGNAIEALAGPLGNLINALVTGLAPSLPIIVSLLGKMAGVITAGLVVIIEGVANGLTAIVKAIPPSVLTALAVAAVTFFAAFKAWTVISSAATAIGGITKAMLGLDASMDANPIGLVVIAIAALGVAFYEAYQKSAGFRQVMSGMGDAFVAAGIVIVQAAQLITNAFLTMVGDVIHGAADAFGWIPGLGSKLKGAAAAFDDWKNGVNDDFNSAINTMKGWQDALDDAGGHAATDLGKIEDAFTTQKQAAADATTALSNYTAAVTENGVASAAAQTARTQLITDLTNAGVNATTAQTDVTSYTNAVAANGTTSSAAQAARQQLITDILNASNNANTGTTDLGNYTAAVRQNGADSSAAQAARAQLITDLENAGVNAKTATGLVDGLGQAVDSLPAGKNINIDVTGQGTWTITGLQALLGNTNTQTLPTPSGHAAGGKIPGYGGGDSMVIAVEPGETILPKEATSDPMTVAVAKKYGVPGFASGGIAGLGDQIIGSYNATQDAMVKSMQQALIDAITKAAAAVASTAASSGAGAYAGQGGSNSANIALADKMAAARGYTPAMIADLNNIIMAESGGSSTIVNPGSGAAGIAQNIQGFGPGYESGNAAQQIAWMLNYLAGSHTWGTGVAAAWANEQANHWYADGGLINEPVTGVGVSGRTYKFGERGPEWVTPMTSGSGVPGQVGGSRVEALLERLIEVTGSLPHGISGGVGNALAGAAQSASMRTRYPHGGA